jgi:hypothetical protein
MLELKGEERLMRKHRCFLYLVNYARTKPEIALRALPTLVQVCWFRERCVGIALRTL